MGEAKRKNLRDCPALGRTIGAAECGQNRNTAIPCPIDCPHNPFSLANYREQFGPLEARVIQKLMAILARKLPAIDRREMLRSSDEYDFHAQHVWHLYGRRLIDDWIEAGEVDEWKNDERFLLECKRTMRVALIEILRIEDENTSIVRDLLQPELGEIRIIDTAFVGRALRFDIYLGWIYRVPCGWRSSGSAISFSAVGDREPEETLEILVNHLGAPTDDRQRWLLEHMMLLKEAITELYQSLQETKLSRSDLRKFSRTFEAKPGRIAGLADQLREHPRMAESRVEDEEPADYDGDLLMPHDSMQGSVAVIGRITIRNGLVLTSALSEARADAQREFLLGLESSLKQIDESVSDLAPPRGTRASQPDLVPPILLEGAGPITLQTQRVRSDAKGQPMFGDQFTAGLLDEPIPLLDGLTPRQAAQRPEMRVRLIRLMKGHVQHLDRLRRNGMDIDLNPQLKEIGLDEIIQPPPPIGDPPIGDPPEASTDSNDEAGEDPPKQPRLEGATLTERLRDQIDRRREIDQQISRHEEFFDWIEDLPRSEFRIEEAEMLVLAARFAIFALHPDLPRGFQPIPERMAAWFDRQFAAAANCDSDHIQWIKTVLMKTGQPDVIASVLELAQSTMADQGEAIDEDHMLEFILALAAVVREVSYWPWQRD